MRSYSGTSQHCILMLCKIYDAVSMSMLHNAYRIQLVIMSTCGAAWCIHGNVTAAPRSHTAPAVFTADSLLSSAQKVVAAAPFSHATIAAQPPESSGDSSQQLGFPRGSWGLLIAASYPHPKL